MDLLGGRRGRNFSAELVCVIEVVCDVSAAQTQPRFDHFSPSVARHYALKCIVQFFGNNPGGCSVVNILQRASCQEPVPKI